MAYSYLFDPVAAKEYEEAFKLPPSVQILTDTVTDIKTYASYLSKSILTK